MPSDSIPQNDPATQRPGLIDEVWDEMGGRCYHCGVTAEMCDYLLRNLHLIQIGGVLIPACSQCSNERVRLRADKRRFWQAHIEADHDAV